MTGTIQIKARLTKRRVTPSVSIYQRGQTVDLGKDPAQDPLELKRTRVVVYLEGPGPEGVDPPIQSSSKSHSSTADSHRICWWFRLDRQFRSPIWIQSFIIFFSLSKPKSFDLGSYDQGESETCSFPSPALSRSTCHFSTRIWRPPSS